MVDEPGFERLGVWCADAHEAVANPARPRPAAGCWPPLLLQWTKATIRTGSCRQAKRLTAGRRGSCQSGLVAKTFNADFYVTCATVIPVLFLGMVVQGGSYAEMLSSALETAQKHPGRILYTAAPQLLPSVAYLALLSGLLGEFFAILALFQRSANPTVADLVLFMTVFLMVVAAAGPTQRLANVMITIEGLAREHRRSGQPPES